MFSPTRLSTTRNAPTRPAAIRRALVARRPATTIPQGLAQAAIVQRKPACSCGGGCPTCSGAAIQPKLTVGRANDKYEREADHVADQVMRMPESQVQRQTEEDEADTVRGKAADGAVLQRQDEEEDDTGPDLQTKPAEGAVLQRQDEEEDETGPDLQTKPADGAALQRQDEEEGGQPEAAPETTAGPEEKDSLAGQPEGLDPAGKTESAAETESEAETLQTKSDGRGRGAKPGVGAPGRGFGDRLGSAMSSGRPLPAGTRDFMESRFGSGFGGVRVHHDQRADSLSRQIGAKAFTLGSHVFFRRDSYAPESAGGRHLLAHELTHVLQQSGSSTIRRKPRGGTFRSGPGASVGRLAGGARALQRAIEVHANLRHGGGRKQTVRIYDSTGKDMDFVTSAGTGTRTSKLIRRRHYPILGKVGPPPKKSYRWGLQYFCTITGGGIGFHSHIAYPMRSTLCSDKKKRYCGAPGSKRVKYPLKVDGTPRSHGCFRLKHGNAKTFFGTTSVGTRVYVYDRLSWRSPSWSSAPDRALP